VLADDAACDAVACTPRREHRSVLRERAFLVGSHARRKRLDVASPVQRAAFMHVTRRLVATALTCGLIMAAGKARAQQPLEEKHVFIEANGGGGLQIGNTDYLPSGAPGDWEFPWVGGWSVGATAGVMLGGPIALIASYEYDRSYTKTGSITGALDEVQGRISYHTAVAGVRLYVPTGYGAFRGSLAVGVLFPYSTQLRHDYGPALAQLPQPITGVGLETTNYSVGYGGVARIGYEFPLFGPIYTALDLELQAFQSENSGEQQTLNNVVTDFTAQPPTAVSTTVNFGDGAARPHTIGVTAGRLLLAVGAAF
jgi:hypothetical protein